MIPLLFDLSDQRVLIFGGGAVAARKARAFTGRSRVTVVSRSFHPSLPSDVERVEAELDALENDTLRSLCRGVFLVIAATSDITLNDRVIQAARSEGAHVNNAAGTPGDVQLPAVSRGERYLVAVSTMGESPGMARFLRESIERAYPSLDHMIALQGRLRSELRVRYGNQDERSALLRQVLEDNEIWAALDHDEERAWELVEARYLHG